MHRIHRSILPILFASTLPLRLVPAQDATTVQHRAEGKYFDVVTHGLDQAAADAALQIVDPVWKAAADAAGQRTPKAAKPRPVVHLYGTEALYVAADQKNTGGRFARNLACALYNGTAHVALQPAVNAEFRREYGLPHQTLRLLAHEATHLSRYQAYASYREHPRWFGDSLAFTVSHSVLESLGKARPFAEEPVFARDLLRVKRLAGDDLLAPVERILDRGTETPDDKVRGQSFYELYAQHQVLGSFLQTDRRGKAWKAACNTLRRLGGGQDPAEVDKALRRSLKLDKGFEKRWQEFAQALAPQWNERTRSLVTITEDSWRQVAFADTTARAYRIGPVGEGTHRLDVEFEFLPAAKKEALVLLGATTDTNVQLILRGDGKGGGSAQFAVLHANGSTHPFGSAPLKIVGRTTIQIAWDTTKRQLTVTQGGKTILTAETEHPLTGAYGLGVGAESAVHWHGFRLAD